MNSGKQKILISGATGMLGSYLIRFLLQSDQFHIVGLKRKSSRMELVQDFIHQIEWREVDLLDVVELESAMEGIHKVYHCAAVVSFDPKMKDYMMEVNVKGTANMINCALEAGVEKFLHVSSVAAIGRKLGANSNTLSESSEWVEDRANSQYAISKNRAEMEVWRGQAEGLNTVVVNPAIIIGAAYWNKGSSKLFQNVYEGFSFYPKGSNGFVDVHDVVRAMKSLMESSISNKRFILAAGNFKYREIQGWIADKIGRPKPQKALSPLLAQVAWRVERLRSGISGKSPLITKETMRTAMEDWHYDHSASKTIPNFSYKKMEDSIALHAKSFTASYPNKIDYAITPF